MNRRFFLKGALAVTALSILPAIDLSGYPTLYGDGVHDDTEALQALFDLKPYICEGNLIQGQTEVELTKGVFKTTDTLHVKDTTLLIFNCTFNYYGNVEKYMLIMTGMSNSLITNCSFDTTNAWTPTPDLRDPNAMIEHACAIRITSGKPQKTTMMYGGLYKP